MIKQLKKQEVERYINKKHEIIIFFYVDKKIGIITNRTQVKC